MAQTKKMHALTLAKWPPEARAAARAFKGIKIAKAPAKLKGKKAAAIKRAMREYFRG